DARAVLSGRTFGPSAAFRSPRTCARKVSCGESSAGSSPQKLATTARLTIANSERSGITKLIGYHTKVTLPLTEDFDPQIFADFRINSGETRRNLICEICRLTKKIFRAGTA